MLQFVHDNIWIARKPMDFLGMDFGSVMTIIRLENGSLLVHSPIELTEELAVQIHAIGNVSVVISPNNFHHQYITQFTDTNPDCHYFYAPGLEKKIRKKLVYIKNHCPLSQFGSTPWDGEIEHLHISGMPFLNEFVFFHKRSKTLIASHLLTNAPPESGNKHLIPKVLYPLFGVSTKGPTQSRLFRSCIRDKTEYNAAIKRLGEWEIHQIIVHQGSVFATSPAELIPGLLAV